MSGLRWFNRVKWFAEINAAQAATRAAMGSSPPGPLPPFDLNVLGRDARVKRFSVWFQNRFFLCYFRIARTIWPFPPLPTFWDVTCVTRAADVIQVLEDTDTFRVPYGPEMTELAGGADFVLGLDGADHAQQRGIIERIIREGDAGRLAEWGRSFALALINGSGGTIDVMSDLVTRVATETCARYFGLHIAEPDAFGEWALSLSTLLFADPAGEPATRGLALNGAERLRAVIDHSIRKSKANDARCDDTLVDRLVTLQASSGGPADDEEARAILVGMVVGFIPTTTLAAGRILEELLRRPERMKDAMHAAASGAEHALKAVLWEAARLNPALQPGQWRYAHRDCVIGKGRWARRFRAGTVLMVSTMSALRDATVFPRPNQFRTDRSERPDFIFGKGPHDCLGWRLAMVQITQVFMVLMAQSNLRTCAGATGGMAWIGPLPRRLDMTFDRAAAPATQTMITVFAPVRTCISKDQLNRLIGALGNPSSNDSQISQALTATGLVHFASMAAVDVGSPGKPSVHLLLELNVDGPMQAALDAVAARAGECLEPIFRAAMPVDGPLNEFLRCHALLLHQLPWAAIGLDFNGTPESPVADIERQADLASFGRDALDHYLRRHVGLGGRAWGALRHVRKLINQDTELVREAAKLRTSGRCHEADELVVLLRRGAGFADFLIRPSRRRPQFPEWVDPGPWTPAEQLRDFFASDGGRSVARFLFLVGFGFTAMNFIYLDATDLGPWLELIARDVVALFGGHRPMPLPLGSMHFQLLVSVPGFLARLIISLVCAVVMEGLILVGLIGGFVWLLRRKEVSDEIDDETPPLADVRMSAAIEDPPGYAQNHFMAVTDLKPGWFRKVTLALALGGIALMVMTRFRRGFVLNMGTIHYAQWFRAPRADKLIFLSNYDGSWESYLEDFIMRAHAGQTAVWSNGVGFPRTSFLINGGAQDGDRFKRWVRRQQQIAPFWFSRFPALTTSQIRNNALIHYGLARARNDAAARAWLGCFGSMQRPDEAIETEEVQSLVFTGFSDLPYAACIILKVPGTQDDRRLWLQSIMPGPTNGEVEPLCFGDAPIGPQGRQSAAVVAFSARGLAKFGVPPAIGKDGLGAFPGAFNMGMCERYRALGDPVPFEPGNGRWSDAEADAALFIYGRSASERDEQFEKHVALLRKLGGGDIQIIRTAPVEAHEGEEYRHEHFGFRDGISQPVIRGTQRFALRPQARDIVEPGEFIFGYANNQGYFPPSPTVRSESDPGHNLSIPMQCAEAGTGDGDISKFPDFDALDPPYVPRDFGRNGTFLVIRQLVQDVVGFDAFTEAKAKEVAAEYPNLRGLTDGRVNADWVAAKLVGRWRDGTPLIDRPNGDPRKAAYGIDNGSAAHCPVRVQSGLNVPDNDFSYGVDDPSGLLCPLGAHIRRANPRDSLQPGDPEELAITNRHRLLRRGRSYASDDPESPEKGLLFVALCADLERQFEFVQQTWLGSPTFHGLDREPDPIAAPGDVTDRVFTIPTASGPVFLRNMQNFVTVKAGGYFFLPSRSALGYLIDLSLLTDSEGAPK